MTKTIRLLDDHTINKIAAGEVIENPSSVVKELIDNALDAGSTKIRIDITQGGRSLIRVEDNGIGMQRDDALLSLERHATSKIQDVEDLFTIDTMGFRGEALPSIASISRLTLHTSKEGESTFLSCEGGKLLSVADGDMRQGTLIEVKDLFFNVPVRRKFQKSPIYDAGEVLKLVMRLSMANPTVSFELTSDNEVVLNTKSSSDLKNRVENVLGEAFLEEAIPIDFTHSGMTLSGFIGMPLASKPNRLSQHLFINRRPVFSPFIAECVREGYGTALPQGKFPLFVLQIQAPKDLIDINVHPQKKEVRLRHFEQFKSLIGKTIRESLFGKSKMCESSFVLPKLTLEEKPSPYIFHEPEFIEDKAPSLFSEPFRQPAFIPRPTFPILFLGSDVAIVKGSLKKEEDSLFTLIDVRALKETVLFNALKTRKNFEITFFLIPHVFTLSLDESEILKENLSALEKSGIVIREFGNENFCLEGLPAEFGDLDLELFIKELMGSLKESRGHLVEEMLAKKVMRSISRSSSDSRILSVVEFETLLMNLYESESHFSPSGKPIYASLDSHKARKVIARNNYDDKSTD